MRTISINEDIGLKTSCNLLPKITCLVSESETENAVSLSQWCCLHPWRQHNKSGQARLLWNLSLLQLKPRRAPPIRYRLESHRHSHFKSMMWPLQANMGVSPSSSIHCLEAPLSHLLLSIRTLLWPKQINKQIHRHRHRDIDTDILKFPKYANLSNIPP